MEAEKSEALELASAVLPLDSGGIDLIFAYGSGIKAQREGEKAKDNMLDLIVAVRDAEVFHRENLKRHAKDYSFLRLLGARRLANFQRDFAAKTYFNTLIKAKPKPDSPERLVKYGVIQTEDLISDLLDWDSLYISGRLQKPVLTVKDMSEGPEIGRRLLMAKTVNLKSAVHASLLTLPERFSSRRFFEVLCGLSYSGDFRTTFGEDKNKIRNIVSANFEKLLELYRPILDDIEQVELSGSSITQDLSTAAVHNHLELLPREVLWGIQAEVIAKSKQDRDLEETIFSLAHRHDVGPAVQRAIDRIVWRSSVRQSLKNAATAGVIKSVVYSSKKILKMIRSLR